ncbi:hypothetical protein PAXRUDRAFT_563222 [Paxillus rubicundulus Ve08.2h10]|uniref:Uncharacterized protein n=1 Tax=Paxillus rubicundulus Ve08.2h10 TaxID=930991 RepID=A0A0D0DM47_9AGAM|nr:hypothetical protein PAXRUDRAFT_563222 [Paxillus rubicundulus Ve08.2h10]
MTIMDSLQQLEEAGRQVGTESPFRYGIASPFGTKQEHSMTAVQGSVKRVYKLKRRTMDCDESGQHLRRTQSVFARTYPWQ